MASGFGVSANPTKQNHSLAVDKVVNVAVKNDNSYISGPNLTPQRLVSGKWVSLDYNSPNPLKPNQSAIDAWDISLFGGVGTYRFKVDVERYDSNFDWIKTDGTFYTSNVVISK